MNKVILMGRLTRDPEIRYSQGENSTAIAKFSLAVDRRNRRQAEANGEPTADFINCTTFGKSAEFMERYCNKGTKLVVCGRIQTGSYTNKEGQKVYTTDVICDEVEFAESKAAAANNGQGGGSYQGNVSYARPASRPEPGSANNDLGFMAVPDNVGDEDLPFQ